jgi:LmbE family N-acetylglucosaminyl deacetylase
MSEVTVDLPIPRAALAVAAHPDDIEFQAGATCAKWAAQGCVIHHLVLTDGSKGSWDPDTDPAKLIIEREEEQRAAARRLAGPAGRCGEVLFLRRPDGALEADPHSVMQVAEAIRRLTPDVVLGHDPWRRYRLHPDHRNAGWIVCDAIVAARDPHFLPELGLEHHRPSMLLLFEADEPDHVERIDDAAADVKVAALLEHRSQYRSTHAIDDPADDAQVDRFRAGVHDGLVAHGALAGLALGEAFKKIQP